MKHTDIITKLNLEQKCALLSGDTVFTTRGYKNAGVPSITLSDGPNGVRKQAGAADHLGLNPSVPATCFPTAATVACSWDPALGEETVRYWMQKENIPLENVLIVVDDLALPFGTLRLKGKGSDAGHNGLKHIAATLGTQNYARLRFGIGSDFPRGGQIDYVLGHFTDEDWKTMDERLEMAGEIIKSFCLAGIDITMNQFNKK